MNYRYPDKSYYNNKPYSVYYEGNSTKRDELSGSIENNYSYILDTDYFNYLILVLCKEKTNLINGKE